MKVVWLLTMTSESGDDFEPRVFSSEPTVATMDRVLEETSPDDFEAGTIYGVLTRLELEEV